MKSNREFNKRFFDKKSQKFYKEKRKQIQKEQNLQYLEYCKELFERYL